MPQPTRSLRAIANEGNPNKVPNVFSAGRLGNLMASCLRVLRVTVATNVATLPETAKAAALLGAYATVGTTTGQATVVAPGATPATGEAAINATGDVAFAGVDAVTEAEIVYLALADGQVIEEVVDVATNVGTPLGSRKAAILLEAEALVGTSTGAKTVAVRGSTPGAGAAAVTDTGTVEFAGADAVTSARIKYVAFPGDGATPNSAAVDLDTEDRRF